MHWQWGKQMEKRNRNSRVGRGDVGIEMEMERMSSDFGMEIGGKMGEFTALGHSGRQRIRFLISSLSSEMLWFFELNGRTSLIIEMAPVINLILFCSFSSSDFIGNQPLCGCDGRIKGKTLSHCYLWLF